jgi:hypothetical protein
MYAQEGFIKREEDFLHNSLVAEDTTNIAAWISPSKAIKELFASISQVMLEKWTAQSNPQLNQTQQTPTTSSLFSWISFSNCEILHDSWSENSHDAT